MYTYIFNLAGHQNEPPCPFCAHKKPPSKLASQLSIVCACSHMRV